jgi:cell division protein FtsB
MARESVTQGVALACLLLLAGIALAGPSGVLAWGENQRLLQQRQQEITRLTIERDELRNRVALLDPRNADSDLAGELLRRNLNVVHPDEMVMLIK